MFAQQITLICVGHVAEAVQFPGCAVLVFLVHTETATQLHAATLALVLGVEERVELTLVVSGLRTGVGTTIFLVIAVGTVAMSVALDCRGQTDLFQEPVQTLE